MKNSILGYVILARDGDGFQAAHDTGEAKSTLWFGNYLSLFKTRAQAQQAIARTETLMAERGYEWPWIGTAVIHPIKAAQ